MRTTLTKYFLSGALLLSAVTLSVAGPVPMDKTVAPVAPMCDWTGFYVGVNGGAGWQVSRFDDQNYAGYEGYAYVTQPSVTYDNVNFVAGGQMGFNYQWRDLVLGIEADADYSGNTINKTDLTNFGESTHNGVENWGWYNVARIDFQGSVRGRLGISLLDNKALIYVTGGAAFVHGDWYARDAYYTGEEDAAYDQAWTGDEWRWGLIGGVGLEYKLNCHWSIKAEGLATWLTEDTQRESYTGVDASTYGGSPNAKFIFADELYSFRVGVNYNFGSFFGH